MKKTIVLLLTVILVLFCCCSCNTAPQNNSESLEDKYYNFAQECIEKGDNENAINALEEGVDKTGSEKLKELLESLKSEKENSNLPASASDSPSTQKAPDETGKLKESEENKFKIPDEIVKILCSTKMQTFGSRPYDFTYSGGEFYYSSDKTYAVFYSCIGSAYDYPNGIDGEIQVLLPAKNTYTANEIQNVFSEYNCEKHYSEIDEDYNISLKYDNYNIVFSGTSANNYTRFSISKSN